MGWPEGYGLKPSRSQVANRPSSLVDVVANGQGSFAKRLTGPSDSTNASLGFHRSQGFDERTRARLYRALARVIEIDGHPERRSQDGAVNEIQDGKTSTDESIAEAGQTEREGRTRDK